MTEDNNTGHTMSEVIINRLLRRANLLIAPLVILMPALLSLTLFLTCLSTVFAYPPEALIINDDFKNPDSGWPEYSDGSASLRYIDDAYSMFVKNSNVAIRCNNLKLGELNDFIAEVDVKEYGTPRSGCVGFVFRMQDDMNHYAFLINNNARTYELIKHISGIPNTLQGWTATNYIKSETSTNRIKIICKGPQIEAYSNGYKLCTVRDTSFTKGFFGFEVDTWVAPQDFRFSNLKVFRGVRAEFLTADSFRNSTVLAQRLQAAQSDGLNIENVEYYPVGTKDFAVYTNKLIDSEPTVIYIMCDPSERDTIKKALQGFNGEIRFDEVYYSNFLDFKISKPVTSQASYRGTDTVQVSTDIDNAGFLSIARATVDLNITDSDGAYVASSSSELKSIPCGTTSKVQISTPLPAFLREGEYTAAMDITAYPDATNKNLSRTESAKVTFKVAGSTFAINYVILPVIALIAGALIAWFITRRKSGKE